MYKIVIPYYTEITSQVFNGLKNVCDQKLTRMANLDFKVCGN